VNLGFREGQQKADIDKWWPIIKGIKPE